LLREGLRNRQQPRVWLTRVLTTAFYDRLRDTRGHDTVSVDEDFDLFDTIVEEDPFPYSDRVHLDFLELFDDLKVIDVLQRVHPSHRTALILAYVYGYKAREIAEISGGPVLVLSGPATWTGWGNRNWKPTWGCAGSAAASWSSPGRSGGFSGGRLGRWRSRPRRG
jgi:hypothetical protein